MYPVPVGHIYYNAGAGGMLIQVLAFVRLQDLPGFDLQLCNCNSAGSKIETVHTFEIGYFLTSSLGHRWAMFWVLELSLLEPALSGDL